MRHPDVPAVLLPQAEAICDAGRSLFKRGYVHGTTGNISVRTALGSDTVYLMTPTDACLGHLSPHRMAIVNATGEQRYGDVASKAAKLHRSIYNADPDARAVVHSHSHHLVLLTLLGVWHRNCVLPPITPYQVMKVGPVPLIEYAVPGHDDVADAVVRVIQRSRQRGGSLRAVLCDRLGPQVWHRDLTQALAVLEELEQTARLWLESGRQLEHLSAAQIQALSDRFGCHWVL